jgi:hypothetical protein
MWNKRINPMTDQRKRFEEAADTWVEQYAFQVPYNVNGPITNEDYYDQKKLQYGKDGFLAGCQHAAPKWVDVKERLPEPEDDVLWCAIPIVEPPTVSSMLTAGFHYKTYTHWQPLPSPPSTPTV